MARVQRWPAGAAGLQPGDEPRELLRQGLRRSAILDRRIEGGVGELRRRIAEIPGAVIGLPRVRRCGDVAARAVLEGGIDGAGERTLAAGGSKEDVVVFDRVAGGGAIFQPWQLWWFLGSHGPVVRDAFGTVKVGYRTPPAWIQGEIRKPGTRTPVVVIGTWYSAPGGIGVVTGSGATWSKKPPCSS